MGLASTHPALQHAGLHKVVVPVRYAAYEEVVHTTSTLIGVDRVHIRSVQPPREGARIEVTLYFRSPAAVVTREAVVAATTSGIDPGFWAEFTDRDERVGAHAAQMSAWARAGNARPLRRLATSLNGRVRPHLGSEQSVVLRNLSGTGAFIELKELPALGSTIDLEIEFPEHQTRELVHAYVVHVSDGLGHLPRGVGVQFGEALASFRLALETYLSRMSVRR